MSANPHRGEREITLNGTAYPLRPSYEAMQKIEAELGNLINVFRRLNEQSDGLSLAELALIVAACINQAGVERDNPMLRGLNREKVQRLIYETGAVPVFEQVLPLIGSMLSGGATDTEKKKEAADP